MADVRNNRISGNLDSHGGGYSTYCGMGVYVKATAKTRIIANVMWSNYIYASNPTGGNAHVWAPPITSWSGTTP